MTPDEYIEAETKRMRDQLAAWTAWADELRKAYTEEWWDKDFYQAVSVALDNRPDKEE